MLSAFGRRTHVSRLFESLRLARGLKPSQLAEVIGAGNVHKVGSMIRGFELSGSINDHWYERLRAELRPDPEELQRCIALDEAKTLAELERDQENEIADVMVTAASATTTKRRDHLDRCLIIDHHNRLIKQIIQCNPPSWNARFRTMVRQRYPGYTLTSADLN